MKKTPPNQKTSSQFLFICGFVYAQKCNGRRNIWQVTDCSGIVLYWMCFNSKATSVLGSLLLIGRTQEIYLQIGK